MSRRHHFDCRLPFTPAGDIINGNKGRDGHFARTDLTGESVSAYTQCFPLIVALPLFQILRLPSHWHRLRAQPALGVQAFTIYGACVCFAVCVFYTVVEKDDPLARGLYIPCPDHYKNYCVHGDCQFPNILAQPSCRYTQIGTWRNLRNNPFLNTKTSQTWQLVLFNFWGREPTTRVNQSYTLSI